MYSRVEPLRPSSMGKNAAIVVPVAMRIGNASSSEPTLAASNGVMPSDWSRRD